jgi:hypothetical protein
VGLIRFSGLVLREAFRHSFNITQTIIFVALAVAGLIVARNPASEPMIEALDVGGWKMVAMVFGTIIAIRLVLAPYWLWKSAVGRITEQPQNSIDWGLRLEHVNYLVDKKKKAIQACFVLRAQLTPLFDTKSKMSLLRLLIRASILRSSTAWEPLYQKRVLSYFITHGY